MLGGMAEDIEWRLPEITGVPFSGKRQGHASIREFFASVTEMQDVEEMELDTVIAQGDTVVVLGHYTWRVKATGRDERNWGDRSSMPAWGLHQTASDEMSLYYSQHYGFDTAHMRCGVFRLDGIASAHAGYEGGELVTKPLLFEGKRLILNYATSASGRLARRGPRDQRQAHPRFRLGRCARTVWRRHRPTLHLDQWSRRGFSCREASPPAVRAERHRPVLVPFRRLTAE